MRETASKVNGKVSFYLMDSYKVLELDPKKESIVMINIYLFGKRIRKSTGYKCSLLQWDRKELKLKTGKARLTNAYEVNKYLSDLKSFVENEISVIINKGDAFDSKAFTKKLLAKIKGVCELSIENTIPQLINYARDVVSNKSDSITLTTERSINQTIKLLKLYETTNNVILEFDSIDLNFYRSFCHLLEEEDYSLNTIGKHIKNLKTFMNEALIHGLTTNQIFRSRSFKVLKETTTQIFLNDKEIEQLANKDLTHFPAVDQARDIFLIGYYTGQRVSDYNGLNDSNLIEKQGIDFIEIKQKKTGSIVLIPVTNNIKKILNKYGGTFPKKMSEPVLSLNIKEAARKAKLDKLIKVSYTKSGASVIETEPQYKLVKTHTARRSFCTNYYLKGKSIQDIMSISGHKTEKMLYNYIRVEREEKAIAIARNGFFD